MALGFSLTNYSAALKKRYSPDFVETMTYKDKPFMALVKKFEDMGGEKWVQPVAFSDPQSRATTVADAQTLAANNSSSLHE